MSSRTKVSALKEMDQLRGQLLQTRSSSGRTSLLYFFPITSKLKDFGGLGFRDAVATFPSFFRRKFFIPVMQSATHLRLERRFAATKNGLTVSRNEEVRHTSSSDRSITSLIIKSDGRFITTRKGGVTIRRYHKTFFVRSQLCTVVS
jgi:hypothetical protein